MYKYHSACKTLVTDNTEFMEENKKAVCTLPVCCLFSYKHPACPITHNWELMAVPL